MASAPELSAPEQQSLLDDKTTGPWSIPKDADPFFRNGIDWAKWEAEAPTPGVYDPPQLRTGWLSWKICACVNWWQQRSPLCAAPVFPCCCACLVYKCCVRDVEEVAIAQPDEWMVKMLSTGTSPNCPKRFQGLFWMHDNIAAHEHLVTWQDAEWATDKLALKQLRYNWTRGPTIFGAILFLVINMNRNSLRIEVSPNEKWVSIAGSSGNPTWMYIPSPGEVYKTPAGETITPGPEDFMRVSFENDADHTTPISYQYRVRKVAYLDDDGNLVKTDAYKELKEAATMPLPPRCTPCCGYCWCTDEETRAFKNLPEMASHTVVKYAPPAPGSVPIQPSSAGAASPGTY